MNLTIQGKDFKIYCVCKIAQRHVLDYQSLQIEKPIANLEHNSVLRCIGLYLFLPFSGKYVWVECLHVRYLRIEIIVLIFNINNGKRNRLSYF